MRSSNSVWLWLNDSDRNAFIPWITPCGWTVEFHRKLAVLLRVPKKHRGAQLEGGAAKGNSPHRDSAIYAESMRLQKTATVLEYLRFLNSDRYVNADHQVGYMSLLRPDANSDSLYGRVDLLSKWYKRNFRIFTNLNRIAEPRDRILLTIGSGYQRILRQLAVDSPDICLVDTAEALR